MADTIIKPDGIAKLEYCSERRRLRRTLEQVELVVEDGRNSIVVLFKESPVYEQEEPKELTIAYKSPEEVEDAFLCIWRYGLKPEDVSKIRQHMEKVAQCR